MPSKYYVVLKQLALHALLSREMDIRDAKSVRTILIDAVISSSSRRCPIFAVHVENEINTPNAHVSFNITGYECQDHVMNNTCSITYCIFSRTVSREISILWNLHVFTEAYIRHWLMRYYLDLVKIIARYEIIIAWYEIIKTCYAKIITLYAILQRNNAIFITRNAIIKF